MTANNDELFEILNALIDEVHTANYARDKGTTPNYTRPYDKAEAALEAYIAIREREARIDELRHLNGFPTSTYDNQPIDLRIAQLTSADKDEHE